MSAKPVPEWVDIDRLANTVPAEGWERYANCRGIHPDLFHPPRGAAADTKAAKAVCKGCPVVYACLAVAIDRMDNVDVGVWGRTSQAQRRAIRSALNHRRRANRKAAA